MRAFVDELTNEWNPASHLTRHLTRSDQIAESDLVGQNFQCERVGKVSWPLVLGENNRISAGWTNAEFSWWCESNHLVLAGIDGRRSYRLAYRGDGDWSGNAAGNNDSSTIRLLGFEKKERNEQQIETALI